MIRVVFVLLFLICFVFSSNAWNVRQHFPAEQLDQNIDSLLKSGEHFFDQKDYVNAINYYLKAVNVFSVPEGNRDIRIAEAHYKLGLCYSYFDYNEFSVQEYQKALEVYKQVKDSVGMAYCWMQIGDAYEDQANYEVAMPWLQRALPVFLKHDIKEGIALCYDNIGSIYEDRAEFNKAFYYIHQSYAIFSALKDSTFLVQEMNNLADIFRRTKQLDSALFYYNQALEMSERIGFIDGIRSNKKDLSKSYYISKDYKKAHDLFLEYAEINQELKIENKLEEIARLNIKSIKDQKDAEIRILEAERENFYLRQILLLCGSGLLLIIIFIIYQYYSLKLRKNKEIEEGRSNLLKIQLENSHLEQLRLERELQLKQQTLSDYIDMLAQKVLMIEELNANKKNEKIDKENPEEMIEVMDELSQLSILTEDDWDIFKNKFEAVYESFFTRLKYYYPELTPGDLRMAALLKLKLSSKDIAKMTGISLESVKKAKARLKKRIIIHPDEKLSEWIKGF